MRPANTLDFTIGRCDSKDMFSCIIDEGLRLELPEMQQAEELAALVQKNLAHLQPWMPWAVDDYSVGHAKQWITMTRDMFAKDGTINALIRSDAVVVGTVGFHAYDPINRKAEIGYWIDKHYEGKGIITKCTRVLIDHLFDKMKLNRVQINCNVENVRSRAIPERLGFKIEGILREVEMLKGHFGDWAIYGMLRSEWRKQDNSI